MYSDEQYLKKFGRTPSQNAKDMLRFWKLDQAILRLENHIAANANIPGNEESDLLFGSGPNEYSYKKATLEQLKGMK